jgi:D-beta-D-heptose 7-phosphate kinase/D-beta-D-heptose 1-phosphate adenosyltransferase
MPHTPSQLPDFASAHVLVVGDVMLDSYWHGATARISPEAPVPIVHIRQEEARVGGAGNVAVNITSLGAAATLLGLAGQDPAADRIEHLLQQSGVKATLQRISGSMTINKLRVMSRHQQLIRLDFEDHFPDWDPASVAGQL